LLSLWAQLAEYVIVAGLATSTSEKIPRCRSE